jgi:outer membrane protein assembly factor BamB
VTAYLLERAEDMMRTLVAVLTALAAMLGASIASAAPVAATAAGSWQTNGRVTAIAVVGSTAYIGGEFTAVRPAGNAAGTGAVERNHAAAIDLATGALLPWNPDANGDVRAIAATATQVYLGGEFSSVGDASASHIAEVDPNTGSRGAAFTAGADNAVLALAISKTTLYAGGKFTTINGDPHTRLAALDTATGQPVAGFSASADNPVKSLVVVPGRDQLVVGGSLTNLDGVARESVGSIDPVTGAIQAWAPRFPYPVISIAATATGVYVAGGGDGGNFVAFDPATAAVDWRGGTDGNAQAITIMNGIVYVGGHFTSYCGATVGGEVCPEPTERDKLVAVNATSGALTSWAPQLDSTLGVYALATGAGAMAAGGDFTHVGLTAQQGFATFH